MWWTIAAALAILWVFGFVSSYTFGGYLHILLLLAVAAGLVSVIQGRRATVRVSSPRSASQQTPRGIES